MSPVSDGEIRRAMSNCTRGEATRMTVPPWVPQSFDPETGVLGWRDPKAPDQGYLLVQRDATLIGIALRAASDRGVRASAMCALCRTTRSAGDVTLFVARRSGPAGRKGDTIGTYACSDLGCANHVRVERATAALQPDPGRTPAERAAGLHTRAAAFAANVQHQEP